MKSSAFIKNYRRRRNKWIPRSSRTGGGLHPKGPNATENKFRREELAVLEKTYGKFVRYEGKTFVITKTAQREYTPDWVIEAPNKEPIYIEVKGSYKLGSEARARLAWELAAEQNPHATFYWAVLTRRGWEIEEWREGGKAIRVKQATESAFCHAEVNWRLHRKRRKA